MELGSISDEIYENLKRDQISLSILSELDDNSLAQLIDSLNISTYNQNQFLIRSLLIEGIKKLRNSNSDCKNTNSISSFNSNAQYQTRPLMTEMKINNMQLLESFENNVSHNVNIYENEHKHNKMNSNQYSPDNN